MNKRIITIAFILLTAIFCFLGLGGVIGAGFVFYTLNRTTDEPVIRSDVPAEAIPPTDVPQTKRNPLPFNPIAIDLTKPTETEILLAETDIPVRDLRQLASRLKYGGEALPEVVNATTPTYQIGDVESFWILDDTSETPRQFQATATLQYITDHTYWWVEDGFRVDQEDLHRSAEVFETQTYPTNRAFFGSEWSPGVDNDPRLSIFLGHVPGVGGYYASSHEFSQAVNPYSNEREMFFINLRALQPGNGDFDGVLAHEFQHMIHWHQDRNEATWVNEGMSELAVLLNGFALERAQDLYLRKPDLQLTTWPLDIAASPPYYGSSYLFMAYFLDQFGEETLKAVVADPANGVQGFNNALHTSGHSETFDDVFANFIIANYLNDPTLGSGQWGYDNLSFKPAVVDFYHDRFPVDRSTEVHQYGVDYIELESDQPLTIDFAGATTTPILDNQAYNGRYQWYSNRGDDSDATLTRAFDLSNVISATLNYAVWFDIEEDWDYAYVEVSTDGGRSWTVLETPHGRNTNPSGNAYGPGYTGRSSGWLEESVDLSPFAGEEILLRFEYITDDATNGPGFALDAVSIPEIGFSDDMEAPDPAWQAAGFIRMDNLLRQRYAVQVIDLSGDQPTVTRMALDGTNAGSLSIGEAGQEVHAVLVVSALAPVTTEVAEYSYSITGQE